MKDELVAAHRPITLISSVVRPHLAAQLTPAIRMEWLGHFSSGPPTYTKTSFRLRMYLGFRVESRCVRGGESCPAGQHEVGDAHLMIAACTVSLLFCGVSDGSLLDWNLEKLSNAPTIKIIHVSAVTALLLESGVLLSSGNDGFVRGWQMNPESPLPLFDLPSPLGGAAGKPCSMSTCRRSPDVLLLAVAYNYALCVFELTDSKQLLRCASKLEAQPCVVLDVAPGAVAVGQQNGILSVWRI